MGRRNWGIGLWRRSSGNGLDDSLECMEETMSGRERKSRVIARFHLPAVIEDRDVSRDWKYSGWRVVVTDTADTFLAQHLIHLVRS